MEAMCGCRWNTQGTLQDQMPFNKGNASTWMLSEFYQATEQAGHPQAIAAEAGGRPDALNLTVIAIGERERYPYIPAVDTMKYLEPRWMTLLSDRWSQDKHSQLQQAWFNGIGVENWQNVWGIYNTFVDFDRASLTRVAAMLRYFGRRGFLQSDRWQPHAPTAQESSSVFASEWPLQNETLWSLVNRNGTADMRGAQLVVAAGDTRTFHDCYRGTVLQPKDGALSFDIEASGYGCVFASDKPPDADFTSFAKQMGELTGRPLASFPRAWHPMQQTMAPVPQNTPPAPHLRAQMISIPAAQDWLFEVSGQEIEGVATDGTEGPWWDGGRTKSEAGDFRGVDVQFSFEDFPKPRHSQRLNVSAFLIDKTPVTCAAYAAYLRASNYVPKDTHNFLRSWSRSHTNGTMSSRASNPAVWTYPSSWGKKPVTWISLGEARRYCQYYSKRLPTTWEWQLAAQGTNSSRLYPWGDDATLANGSACPPLIDHSNDLPPPADVDAYPQGASPYGVLDIVGNVWSFVESEFRDAHTRAVLLRGGRWATFSDLFGALIWLGFLDWR